MSRSIDSMLVERDCRAVSRSIDRKWTWAATIPKLAIRFTEAAISATFGCPIEFPEMACLWISGFLPVYHPSNKQKGTRGRGKSE
jgi:hypothetical protein